ncbi:hypothetical protein Bca52824_069117 [Brassica carinata]|uniref:NTF2 domain-containing protein n=1 Tax=Brassica carinata TaxID=52824 RepID=A0A8X7Q535_BRACI|nr:hypothetical protein Bca52824_069117 [Brassica carinata]
MDKKILALGDGVIGARLQLWTHKSLTVVVFPAGDWVSRPKDGVRRTFTQSFFLSPQENGYLVFNDMFLYINEATTVVRSEVFTPNQEEQYLCEKAAPGIVHEALLASREGWKRKLCRCALRDLQQRWWNQRDKKAKPLRPSTNTVVREIRFKSKCVNGNDQDNERGNHRGRSAFGVGTGYRNEGGRGRGSCGGGRGRNDFNGYGSNRGNNNRGGYANRANNDGGGFPRRGRRGSGGGIDANRATKHVDAPRVKEESGVDINLSLYFSSHFHFV